MFNKVLATFHANIYNYNRPTLGQYCIPNSDGQALLYILLMLGQRSNSDVNSRPTIQPTTNVGPMQSFYLGCRLIKIGYSILRQSYYIRVQDLTYFSANGCREDTSEPLSILFYFRFLNLQNKFVTALFFSCSK